MEVGRPDIEAIYKIEKVLQRLDPSYVSFIISQNIDQHLELNKEIFRGNNLGAFNKMMRIEDSEIPFKLYDVDLKYIQVQNPQFP